MTPWAWAGVAAGIYLVLGLAASFAAWRMVVGRLGPAEERGYKRGWNDASRVDERLIGMLTETVAGLLSEIDGSGR